MIFAIFVVVPPITLIAEVTLGQKTRERVTPIVMVIFFDDTDDLVRWCGSHEDGKFGDATWSPGYPC